MTEEKSLEAEIREALIRTLNPERLLLVNESSMHNVPKGSETHWNAIVVSRAFDGQTPVTRQRQVYAALAEQFKRGLHALTMKTLTPSEWDQAGGEVSNPAPLCRGGSKK